jgi:hypothetical protein
MEDMRCQLEYREANCCTQETAVMDGFDCCRVEFLPRQYVPDTAVYDGVLCQVIEVFSKDDPSCAISNKWKKHKGFARAMVTSQLNGQVLNKIKGMEIKVAPVKGDYFP